MVLGLKERLLSSDKKDTKDKKDKKDEKSRSSSDASPPPSYRATESVDYGLSASIRKLNLVTKNASGAIPTNDECIVHLKFLTALAHLREEISETDGLFGLHDALAEDSKNDLSNTSSLKTTRTKSQPQPQPQQIPGVVKVREKRWAVYATRAVDRFQKWWETLLPGHGRHAEIRMDEFAGSNPVDKTEELKDTPPLRWTVDMLPPIDVLMVLHSYMLNPRDFLDDCIRYGMLPVWSAGFPWELVNAAINDRSFEYSPVESTGTFESKTGLAWDNLQDPHTKKLECASCHTSIHHAYTDGNFGVIPDKAFEDGRGFADKSFSVTCIQCNLIINHEALIMNKFNHDVQRLVNESIPMPGTILSLNGTPDPYKGHDPTKHDIFFPNRLILAGLAPKLLDVSKPDVRYQGLIRVEHIRKEIEDAIHSRNLVTKANGKTLSKSLKRLEKIAVRRMMSKYWANSSPYGLDLVGAVVRQGVFVDKMKAIDWIHSPALENTITRLIAKYVNFFKLIEQHPWQTAVPTLDVDLAWHTHQLRPQAYYLYSLAHANKVFIDHDDKIDENKLSTAFEWTSRAYAKLTNGEVYSECTCWYCEAIREASSSRSLNLFSSSAKNSNNAALGLHDRKDISADPNKNPHISAHNAVRADTRAGSRIAEMQAQKLEQDYERAAKKARKAGRNVPDRNAYANGYLWGYPMFMPYYVGAMGGYGGGYYGSYGGPYCADPSVSGGMYASNPSCMSVQAGAAGNCVAGACGGGVAAGACGAGGAACAGGMAGGCGGGGGGGGCGGGGGGCGGGGGA